MAALNKADTTAKSNKFVPTKASKAREKYQIGVFHTDQTPYGFVVLFSKTKKFVKAHPGLQPTDVYLSNPGTASNGNLRFNFVVNYNDELTHVGMYYPAQQLSKEDIIKAKTAGEIQWSTFRGEQPVHEGETLY